MKKLNYILYFMLLLAVTSCEEVIDVDIPADENKVVVEGYVTTERDSSYVRLSRTLSFFDNTSPVPQVINAAVTVNNDTFYHVANGIYRPAAGYTGIAGTAYNLRVLADGKLYTSTAMLDPMYQVDTLVTVFKAKEGFIDEGYTVKFIGRDDRPRVKYTYFRFGFKNELETQGKDSFEDFRVLFDNKNSVLNTPYEFELPFLRLKENDTVITIFRSVDENVYRYLLALGNRQGGGGPFSVPPANLPTNINGGGLGIFAAYDVKRFRYRIVK